MTILSMVAMAAAAGGFGQGQDTRFDVQFAYPAQESRVEPTTFNAPGYTLPNPTTSVVAHSVPTVDFVATAQQSTDAQKELEKRMHDLEQALKSADLDKAMQEWAKSLRSPEFLKAMKDFEKSLKSEDFTKGFPSPEFLKSIKEFEKSTRSLDALTLKKDLDVQLNAKDLERSLGNLNATTDTFIQNPALPGTLVWSNYSAAEQKKVNASFANAPAREVLAWLQKQGVSFIVADEKVDASRKVTLNASNVPLGALVDSLATALGGHWENQNGIRVFKTGPGRMTLPSIRYINPPLQATPKIPDRILPRVEWRRGDQKLVLGTSDLKGFVKSLTPAQKDLQAKQGFLKFSDLTAAQRKMLGSNANSSGKFQISIDIDGQKVVIKND